MSEYIVEVNDHPTIKQGGWNVRCDDLFIQHEEIVRCRDCKWFTPEYWYEEERGFGVKETLCDPPDCGNPERCNTTYDSLTGKMVPVHIVTEPDGFCAWGERKRRMGYGFGDWVVYDPGYKQQIGRVTECREDSAFVCYSLGCTAASTPLEYLRPATDAEVAQADPMIGFNRFHEYCPSWDEWACLGCRARRGCE